ncbi:MAG: DASS family sodium-coupled anion symporter [Lachnospiraceae bacterium]
MSKTVSIGVIIWFIPAPSGVDMTAWHLLAIFIAAIIGFILQPLPIGVITFIALTLSILTGILEVKEAMSGYSSSVVWLIISAFLFSRSLIKTGLGKRIAYMLMKLFGSSSLKLGYALSISNFIISPAIPSNTARAGGIMFPIVRSIAEVFDSKPGASARKIGAYLIQTVYQTDNVSCGVFMTAMAGNVLVVSFASQVADIQLSWGLWALAAIVPGLVSIALIPLVLYKIFPPEIKETPEAKSVAIKELEAMGAMTIKEKVLLGVFLLAIIGWATTAITGLDATAIAMACVCIMLISGILEWSDVTTEKGAWDAMIWMGGILGLPNNLADMGIFEVFANFVGNSLGNIPWTLALIALVLVYIFSTYAFASGVAHITAMYPVFLAVVLSLGAPTYLAALALSFASALYQGLTHYASGPSAIFFAGGYVEQ